jgi:hypothetical protein
MFVPYYRAAVNQFMKNSYASRAKRLGACSAAWMTVD